MSGWGSSVWRWSSSRCVFAPPSRGESSTSPTGSGRRVSSPPHSIQRGFSTERSTPPSRFRESTRFSSCSASIRRRGRHAPPGLSEDEVERTLLQLSSHPNLRALEIKYRYREDELGGGANLPHAAIVGRAAGRKRADRLARRRSPARPRPSSPRRRSTRSTALARRAGPALENARRYSEARELAELDSLTGLHNRRLFYEFLAREIARAHRYERHLALIVLDLDDFKRINDRIGHLGGDGVLADVAERIRLVVRTTDIPCRVGGDEFAVILPESTRDDAELLADRLGSGGPRAEDREDRRAEDLGGRRRAPPHRHRRGSLHPRRQRPLPGEEVRQGPNRRGLTGSQNRNE